MLWRVKWELCGWGCYKICKSGVWGWEERAFQRSTATGRRERERERWGRMKGGECRCGCNDDGWGRDGAGCGSNWQLNCGALISNQGASSIKWLLAVAGDCLPNKQFKPLHCTLVSILLSLSLPNKCLSHPVEWTYFSKGFTATGLFRRKDREPVLWRSFLCKTCCCCL